MPVADYLAAYEDEMEGLRAFDRALFGGSPERGARRVPGGPRRSPTSTPSRAPVLVLAGENDPRCPIRQIDNYLDALEARGQGRTRSTGSTPVTARWSSRRRSGRCELALAFALRHVAPEPDREQRPPVRS